MFFSMGAVGTSAEFFSRLAGLTFLFSTIKQAIPKSVSNYIENLWGRLYGYFYPCVRITFHEYSRGMQNESYSYIRTYLGTKSSKKATNLTADKFGNSKSLNLNLDEGEETIDVFNGVQLSWKASKEKIQDNASYRRGKGIPLEKNYYVLVFQEKYRDMVTETYLEHVMEEAKAIELSKRKRKLYTNKDSEDWYWNGGKWSHIHFKHPATFDTLAMEPKKKQEIVEDLEAFKNGKDYYERIGKAWKRGYLLHGPPGTGKSSMIAAIANFMEYDIYDLELTSVNNNSELKQLLIDTRSKSIIVIEDIDCSLDLTGKRNKKESKEKEEEEGDSSSDDKDDKSKKKSKVTLSGLLNFIDGIWSACGQERIIIFTTNYVNKLDPALIRRGRMDMHIELSYCKFEAFKILAKNYLDIDSHPLFEEIRPLLEENNVSPCDVAENLMSKADSRDADYCLKKLVEAINTAKEKAELEAVNTAKEKAKLEGQTETKAEKVKARLLSKSTFFKISAKLVRKRR